VAAPELQALFFFSPVEEIGGSPGLIPIRRLAFFIRADLWLLALNSWDPGISATVTLEAGDHYARQGLFKGPPLVRQF